MKYVYIFLFVTHFQAQNRYLPTPREVPMCFVVFFLHLITLTDRRKQAYSYILWTDCVCTRIGKIGYFFSSTVNNFIIFKIISKKAKIQRFTTKSGQCRKNSVQLQNCKSQKFLNQMFSTVSRHLTLILQQICDTAEE